MKRLLLIAALTAAALAWAGSRAAESSGTVPTSATAGVSISQTTACRGSVRVDDGGAVMGGALQPYYYDAVLGWVESSRASACTLDGTLQLDGGQRSRQVCEWAVNGQFGRVALVANGLVNDAGTSITATVRLECSGADLP